MICHILLVLFTITNTSSASTNRIYIDPSGNCNDTTRCLQDPKACCKTLDFVLENARDLSNTILDLSNKSMHFLNKHFQLWNISQFQITSSSGRALINCLDNNAGLNFIFTENIGISNIVFEQCGASNPSTTYGFNLKEFPGPYNVSEVIRFGFSKTITITDSTFLRNNGVAVAMYDTIGTVIFKNNVFEQNSNQHDIHDKEFISGGGLFIEFTYCGILDPVNCAYQETQRHYNKGGNFLISDCQFLNNFAEHRYEKVPSEDSFEREHVSFGKGGGVALILLGNASKHSFTIEHSVFRNNKAHWGAAVLNTIRHNSSANKFYFHDTSFYNNSATFGGGGIRLHSFNVDRGEDDIPGNKVNYNRLNFYENFAIWGGGISIAGITRTVYSRSSVSRDVEITDCIFDSNIGTVGFGVGLATWNINTDPSGPGMSYRVIFENTLFHRNKFEYTEDGKVIGQGALYSDEVTLVFKGTNRFLGNGHTAIVLETSSMVFERHSNTMFENNTGLEGGAVAMYGNSWINLHKNTTIVFRHNEASTRGGAIYNRFAGPPRAAFVTTQLQSSACFLRYENDSVAKDDWNVSISFIKNNAPNFTGNSLYATTLQFCRQYDDLRNNTKAFEWKFIHYVKIDSTQHEIDTDAVEIDVQDKWNVSPDLPFRTNIRTTDEKGHDVYGTVKLSIKSNQRGNPVELDPPNNIFVIGNDTTKLQLLSKQKTQFDFQFETINGQLVSTGTLRGTLEDCLLGYKKVGDNCVCMNTENHDIFSCESNGDVYLVKGKWATKNNEDLIETFNCPSGYCICHESEEVSESTRDFACLLREDYQCSENREGPLCSKCTNGYSVQLGSEKCTRCDNKWLYLIIPILACLFLFVFVIFYFNISAFSGYLNCFLYSYQMIPIMIPENVELDPFITIVMGITGLSGSGGKVGFCLYNGMDNLQKNGINYAIPFTMVLFSILMGKCIPSKLWQRYSYRRNITDVDVDVRAKSFGSAISFVLVYSYSMFTRVTINILTPVTINGESRMQSAAYVRMFGKEHIAYGLIAILVLVSIVILFPIILLSTPFFASRFQWILRSAPILNALKDCFKDNATCRSFAAFYFFCRLLLLTMVISNDEQLILMLIFNILFLTLFTSVQPYKEKTCNYWDAMLLCNICIINAIGIVVSVPSTQNKNIIKSYQTVLHVAVYIPLLTVLCRLLWYLYCKFIKKEVKPGYQKIDDKTISAKIRRWRNRKRNTMIIPERVVEDFESDYVELNQYKGRFTVCMNVLCCVASVNILVVCMVNSVYTDRLA